MNKKNMLKVADAIERRQVADRKIGFNMRSFLSDDSYDVNYDVNDPDALLDEDEYPVCGTTACVAGFATLLEAEEMGKKSPNWYMSGEVYFNIGARYLGLTDTEASGLFVNAVGPFNEHHPLVPDALRYMAVSGSTDWKEAIEVARCAKEKA